MGKIADAIRGLGLPQQKQAQMLRLDRQFEELEAKVKILETENQALQAQVNPLKREVERLKQQQERETAKRAQTPTFNEEAKAIVQFLAQGHQRPTLQELASQMNAHPTRVEHFLNELCRTGHAQYHEGIGGLVPPTYSLSPLGQAYAVEHGFV
ncbi:MAG TPA: hypothetical protein VHP37_03105 [Burkholderiales bacterium]|nr:hypothetical protein [Burkholderiales bacterium]